MVVRKNSPRPQEKGRQERVVNDLGESSAINCTAFSYAPISAINCNSDLVDVFGPPSPFLSSLPASVTDLVRNSVSENTRRAYRFDLDHFAQWGGTIPASPNQIASYIADMAATHAPATISRRLAGLSKGHRARGLDDPTKSEIVKSTLRGIRRKLGTAQREAKPILKEDLFAMLERMGDATKDRRDKALLLIGFAGAFRRSELVGLNVSDIEHVRQGIIITLHRSKTDQTGEGRKIGIPFGRTRWCPVAHLTDWLEHAGITEGPIFRPIARGGSICNQRLSGEAVSIIIKVRVTSAGFDPDCYSGHSLRAGLATSAAMAGASTWKIRAQTGHASDAMLMRYIRDGGMFEGNATGLLL